MPPPLADSPDATLMRKLSSGFLCPQKGAPSMKTDSRDSGVARVVFAPNAAPIILTQTCMPAMLEE